MNARVASPRPAFGTPVAPRKKQFPVGWVILGIVLLLGGGGFWYYFFGKKPRVVLTVSLPSQSNEFYSERNGWDLGNRELLLLADGELKLVDLKDRSVKWTSKVPAAPAIDPAHRAALNSRFVRLQEWANELNRKRAALKTPEDTKAFNAEAAKYQAELAASRALVAKAPAPAAAEAGTAKADATAAAQPAATAEKKAPSVDEPAPKLNPIITPEMQLLEARIQRREAQITTLAATIKTKKAAAKTEIQLSAVGDDERRLASLQAEQKDEQAQLAQIQGKQKPAVAAQESEEDEEEPAPEWHGFSEHAADAFAGVVGTQVYLVDAQRMTSFDRATGELKSDTPLAGPVLKAWQLDGEICIVASAGPEARQVTRITASKGPISLYVPAGKVGSYLEAGAQEEMMARIEKYRTEFCGPLLRADIKLVERKVTQRDAIKPESEKELTDAVNNARAHSSEELLATVKLLQNDGKRARGALKIYSDESTYEVALERPFDSAIPPWKGTFTGRVELHSATTCDLLAGGTKVVAIDRANRKLWEAPLGAPIGVQDSDDKETRICLETGNRLFFADGAFLTAFETATGKVLWRLPSIGIRKLQVDADGNLYVHSRNLPTEALSDADFEDLSGEIHPLTLKVDSESGKIDWQVEKYEDIWVSGKDVYALRQGKRPEDIEEQVFDPGKVVERVKLYKLSRSTGEPIWEWFQPRRPRSVHADRKTVGLLFQEELQVLHSIAY